jgi:hypothetical protein
LSQVFPCAYCFDIEDTDILTSFLTSLLLFVLVNCHNERLWLTCWFRDIKFIYTIQCCLTLIQRPIFLYLGQRLFPFPFLQISSSRTFIGVWIAFSDCSYLTCLTGIKIWKWCYTNENITLRVNHMLKCGNYLNNMLLHAWSVENLISALCS